MEWDGGRGVDGNGVGGGSVATGLWVNEATGRSR